MPCARAASKLPAIDALLARYASQQRESRRYGGRAAAAANPVGAADGGGGPPGELTSAAIWAATRRELAAHEDSVFTWYSVGCDDCGVFPIVGRRYRYGSVRQCTAGPGGGGCNYMACALGGMCPIFHNGWRGLPGLVSTVMAGRWSLRNEVPVPGKGLWRNGGAARQARAEPSVCWCVQVPGLP